MTNKEKFKTLQQLETAKYLYHKSQFDHLTSFSDDSEKKISMFENVLSVSKLVVRLVRAYRK